MVGVKLKNPKLPKERNLLKGAIRRQFSRSELRKQVLEKVKVEHEDKKFPRVKRWGHCPECLQFVPLYKFQVDHIKPIVGVYETLEQLTWDEVVDRVFCDESNLRALCKACHLVKTKIESKQRREFKKLNKAGIK